MEHLILIEPDISYRNQAIEYIKELIANNSSINGVGGLQRYLDNYEAWLEKLRLDRLAEVSEERVPAETYFLVRVEDNRLVGMINIRLALNERLLRNGGHIGYSIRPSERRQGYNKINLYLALLRCQELGITEVYLDCNDYNLASARSMIALGGIKINEHMEDNELCYRYSINVNDSIKNHQSIYEPHILKR